MFLASELATNRSVMEKADRISPFNNGTSHFFFCSGLPYFANTSIFPVSGAAQLVAYTISKRRTESNLGSKTSEPRQFSHDCVLKVCQPWTLFVSLMEKEVP